MTKTLSRTSRAAVEVGPGDDADDDQRDQHADQAEVAPTGSLASSRHQLRRAGASGPARGGRVAVRRLGTRTHTVSSISEPASKEPAITRSSTESSVRSAAGASWMTRPSRMTSTRSARPSTSGTSLETSSTPTPRAARSRMT